MVRPLITCLVGEVDPSLRCSHATDWFTRAEDKGASGETLGEVLRFRRVHDQNASLIKAGASNDDDHRLVKRTLDRRRTSRGRGGEMV